MKIDIEMWDAVIWSAELTLNKLLNAEHRLAAAEEAYLKLARAHELVVAVTMDDMKIDYTNRTSHTNEINSLQDDIRVLEEDRDHWKQKALKRKKHGR